MVFEKIDDDIMNNAGLVWMVIRNNFNRFDDYYIDEFYSIGLVALWKAIQSHDSSKGSLSTVATIFIKNSITDYIRVHFKSSNQHNNEYVSLDKSFAIEQGDEGNMYDFIPCPYNLECSVMNGFVIEDILKYLKAIKTNNSLSKTNSYDVLSDLVNGMEYDEIALHRGVSRARISQIVIEARRSITQHFGAFGDTIWREWL